MKVVLTVLVRDEADVIGEMVRYHLEAGVDHVIAMDNASRDGTTEILREFAATGALTYLHKASDAYLQDVWATEMLRLAEARHGADWVISSDADEFWLPAEQDGKLPPDGGLREVLAAHQGFNALRCDRRNLFCAVEDLEARPWSETLLFTATPPQDKPENVADLTVPLAPPSVYHRMPPKLIVRPHTVAFMHRGAHAADFRADVRPRGAPIVVYHVPCRSREEFARSIGMIGPAVEKDASARPNQSSKYRRWSTMLRSGAPIDTPLAEMLPPRQRLADDLAEGRVARDTTLREAVRNLGPRHQKLFVRSSGVPDPTALATLVLVVGSPNGSAGLVAQRLADLGLRRREAREHAEPDALRALHDALLAEGSANPLEAARTGGPVGTHAAQTLRQELFDVLANGLGLSHGVVIEDSTLAFLMPHYRALARAFELSVLPVLCVDAPATATAAIMRTSGVDADEAARVWLGHMLAAEIGCRGTARIVASSRHLLALPNEGWRTALSGLGLHLARHWSIGRRQLALPDEERPADDNALNGDLVVAYAALSALGTELWSGFGQDAEEEGPLRVLDDVRTQVFESARLRSSRSVAAKASRVVG